jgi:hypothetical protein
VRRGISFNSGTIEVSVSIYDISATAELLPADYDFGVASYGMSEVPGGPVKFYVDLGTFSAGTFSLKTIYGSEKVIRRTLDTRTVGGPQSYVYHTSTNPYAQWSSSRFGGGATIMCTDRIVATGSPGIGTNSVGLVTPQTKRSFRYTINRIGYWTPGLTRTISTDKHGIIATMTDSSESPLTIDISDLPHVDAPSFGPEEDVRSLAYIFDAAPIDTVYDEPLGWYGDKGWYATSWAYPHSGLGRYHLYYQEQPAPPVENFKGNITISAAS